ncbi:MAG: hypothetical protein WDW36_007050 [Sanguina aurantia]
MQPASRTLANNRQPVHREAHSGAPCLPGPDAPARTPTAARWQVPEGSYDGVRYCPRCRGPKPAEAHHCSSCGKCFVGLDHHCPFLDSCVARGNQRNFICMLAWTSVAMLYGAAAAAVCMTGTSPQEWVTMHTAWATAFQHRERELAGLTWVVLEALAHTPAHLLASAYIVVASLGVGTAVAVLLTGQLRHLYLGTTYVEELQRGAAAGGGAVVARLVQPRSLHGALSRVLGSRHVWAWLLPAWGPAPGVLLLQQVKKLA